MLTTFLLLACVGKGKYEALQADFEATKTELAAVKATVKERDERVVSLEEALANEKRRVQELETERARLLTDQSALKGSVEEMQAALRELDARRAAAESRIGEYRQLLARFKSLIDAGKLRVKIVDGRMVVELATDILFGSGSADLSPAGKTAIVEVAQVLASIPDRKFQVEGHTDNVPIKTAQYPSNWELAAARALTVVKTLVEGGLPADRVSAASFGDQKPVAPNETPEGKAANRRIEIVVVPDLSSLPGFEELNKAAGG